MIPTLTPAHFISGLNKPQEDYGTDQIRGVVGVFTRDFFWLKCDVKHRLVSHTAGILIYFSLRSLI